MFIKRAMLVFSTGIIFVMPAYFCEFVIDCYGLPFGTYIPDFMWFIVGCFVTKHLQPLPEHLQWTYRGEYPQSDKTLKEKSALAERVSTAIDLSARTPRLEIPVIDIRKRR